jgi:hypothetical protein
MRHTREAGSPRNALRFGSCMLLLSDTRAPAKKPYLTNMKRRRASPSANPPPPYHVARFVVA